MAKPSDPAPVSVRQCRMLPGRFFTTPSPQYQCCSSGQRSWCKFNWALANSEPSPPHSPTIHPDIVPPLKKVFKRLFHPTLMESCVLGATQNLNESFNSTIWQHCPKTVLLCNHGEDVVNLAVISFNSGQVPFTKFQERLEVTVSPPTRQYLSDKDHHRVSASVMKAEVQVKKRWQAQHLDRVALAEQQVAEEGETYGSGRFSHHRTGRTHLRS